MAVHLNRKQKRAAHSILKKKGHDLEISTKTEELFKIAHKQNMVIFGEKTELGNGIAVDFSHFEFVLSIFKPSKEALQNNMKLLTEFWITFYPQLSGLAETAEKLDKAWHSMLVDQKAVLAQFADLDYRDKMMEKYLENEGLEEHIAGFSEWFEPKLKQMKEEQAAIIEKEAKELLEKELSV